MKKFLLIIGILASILTIFEIVQSYASFETVKQSDADLNVAKWHINVNDYEIGAQNTFYIDEITYLNNEGVSEGKFAPGVTGKFIIEIDPRDTDVAIRYDLNISMSKEYAQIQIDSIQGINGTMLTKQGDNYSRIISLNDIQNQKTDQIEVTFSWKDEEQYNESDSILGLDETSQIRIPITIEFNQYIN